MKTARHSRLAVTVSRANPVDDGGANIPRPSVDQHHPAHQSAASNRGNKEQQK
jgi:hypothetical protein